MGAGLNSTLERDVAPVGAPPRGARPVLSAGVLAGLVVLLLGAGVVAAAPAAAIEDPRRPDARVTHGPSCRPGGLVVEVVAGTAAYAVRLGTTRLPAGEDEATLDPRDVVVLRTGDVAWGETIDARLEFTAADGSGVTYVDELEDYTLTRPSREDCAALTAPPPLPAPSQVLPSTSPASTPAVVPGSSSSPGPMSSERPVPSPGSAPAPSSQPTSSGPALPPQAAPRTPGTASTRSVDPGGTVILRAAGFLPGERVTVLLEGTGEVLATATAGPDGAVRIEVRIPSQATAGPATVDIVGDDSAVTADVALQVAAAQAPAGRAGVVSLASLVAAAVALVGTTGGLVAVAGQQRTAARYRPHRAA